MMSSSQASPAHKQRSPWWVVFGGGIASAVGPSPFVLSTLGIFLIPIEEETGFSRATIAAAYSVAAIGMAIGLVVVGRLLDKFAVRYILVPSYVLFGVFTALVAVTPPIEAVFLVPYFLLGFFGAGTFLPTVKAVVTWFDNKRALAGGVVAAFLGLGSSIAPILAGVLVVGTGWRPAYAILGLLSIVISVTVIMLFVRGRAESNVRGRLVKETVDGGRQISLEVPGLTLREAVRTRYFWQILVGLPLVAFGNAALAVHLAPMAMDRGIDPLEAALLLSVFGLASLVGRIVVGFIIDRVYAPIVGAIVIIGPVVALLLLNESFTLAAVAVALMGVAFGIEFDLVTYFITRYLGMKAFGRISGVLQAVMMVGSALGPLVLGLAYDAAGSYEDGILWLIVTFVVAALCTVFLGRYRYPAVAGFDKLAAEDEFAAAGVLSAIAESEGEGEGVGAPASATTSGTRSAD